MPAQLLNDDIGVNTFQDNAGFECFIDNVGNYLTCPGSIGSSCALVCAPNPSGVGVLVTFTGTASGPSTTPTGKVEFTNGGDSGIIYGPVSLTAGIGSFSISSLAIGSYPIQAIYLGDTTYNPSASATITQVVNSSGPPPPPPPPPPPYNLMGQICMTLALVFSGVFGLVDYLY